MTANFRIYRTNGLTRKTDCVGSYSNSTFTAGSVTVKDVANVYTVQATTKVVLNGRPCLAVEVYITTAEGTLCRVLIGGSEEVYPTVKKEATVNDILEIEDEEEMP